MRRTDTRKAYGVVTAIGTKLGEKARADDTLLPRIRNTSSADDLMTLLRAEAEGLLPGALLDNFATTLTEAEWMQWRARLLLQVKLTRDGGKPAPGHEAGRGVRKG